MRLFVLLTPHEVESAAALKRRLDTALNALRLHAPVRLLSVSSDVRPLPPDTQEGVGGVFGVGVPLSVARVEAQWQTALAHARRLNALQRIHSARAAAVIAPLPWDGAAALGPSVERAGATVGDGSAERFAELLKLQTRGLGMLHLLID